MTYLSVFTRLGEALTFFAANDWFTEGFDTRGCTKHALRTAPPSVIGRSLLVVAIVAAVAIAFVAGDSLVYLFARSLHLH
jgi:hypothetical protein